MKTAIAVTIAVLAMATPAFADVITIEFTSTGVSSGSVTVDSSTSVSGSDIAISEMIVSGDGAFDGTYSVTGTADGFGALSFDTSSSTIEIVGGVSPFVPDGTTLLQQTGGFSNISVAMPSCDGDTHTCPTVSFDAPDVMSAALMSDLEITHNVWQLSALDVADGTGNAFPELSADIQNTNIPEPASMALLGAALVGFGLIRRRRKAV